MAAGAAEPAAAVSAASLRQAPHPACGAPRPPPTLARLLHIQELDEPKALGAAAVCRDDERAVNGWRGAQVIRG